MLHKDLQVCGIYLMAEIFASLAEYKETHGDGFVLQRSLFMKQVIGKWDWRTKSPEKDFGSW